MTFLRTVRTQRMSNLSVSVISIALAGILSPMSNLALAQMPPKLPAEAFAQLPQVSDPKFSPDGTYLSMIRPYKGVRHLFIQPLSGEGKQVVIPPEGSFQIRWADWATNERLLVGISFEGWRSAIPTAETRLIATNRDGSSWKNVVQRKKDKNKVGTRLGKSGLIAQFQDDVVDFLRDDPDHFLLAVDSDRDGSDELRRVNIHTGNYVETFGEMRGVQNWKTDLQGNIRFAWGVDTRSMTGMGKTRRQLIYYRHADGRFSDFSETPIYQQGFATLAFAKNPDHAYMHGTGEHGRRIIIKYDMRTEEILEIYEHEEFDAVGLRYDGADDTPIGVRFSGDAADIIFDPAWAKRYRMINKALKGTHNVIVSSNSTRTLHLINSWSDTDPGVYYVFDAKAKAISQLSLEYDQLDPAHMAPSQVVSYEARDGLTIPAILTLPVGSDGKDLPTVIMPHGGPHSRSTTSFHYRVQFLANRGYAVLQPNFRGSTGYGTAFLRAGYEQWGLKMQDDITDGTKWLIDQGISDPERICIVGVSYGGYAALMGAVKEPDLFACAVSINGVADIPKLLNEASKYIGGALGTDNINQTDQKNISPIRRTDAIKAPILLIATKDDRNVDYRQSKRMARALKKARKEHKYVEMTKGDHGLTTEASRKTSLVEIEAFLAKHIGKGR